MGGAAQQAMRRLKQFARVQLCCLTAKQQNVFYFVSLSLGCLFSLNFDNTVIMKGIQTTALVNEAVCFPWPKQCCVLEPVLCKVDERIQALSLSWP